MSGWSPPSVPRSLLIGFGALYILVVVYSVLVVQQILLGVVFPATVAASLYVLWRFLVAIEAIADALHRIADRRDRE